MRAPHSGFGCGVTNLAMGALTATPAGWDVSPVLCRDACKQNNNNLLKKSKLFFSVSILKKAGVEEAALGVRDLSVFRSPTSQHKLQEAPPPTCFLRCPAEPHTAMCCWKLLLDKVHHQGTLTKATMRSGTHAALALLPPTLLQKDQTIPFPQQPLRAQHPT